MSPNTIAALEKWITKNNYNNSYGVGNRKVYDGFVLEKTENGFVWYYTERGTREDLNFFETEKEAVDFAVNWITHDATLDNHLVGFIKIEDTKSELLAELKRRNVEYSMDKIPINTKNQLWYRVFVKGGDIEKVLDLKEKFT